MTLVYLPSINPSFTKVINSRRFVSVDRDLQNQYWDANKLGDAWNESLSLTIPICCFQKEGK